jgi:hypothetical protein
MCFSIRTKKRACTERQERENRKETGRQADKQIGMGEGKKEKKCKG